MTRASGTGARRGVRLFSERSGQPRSRRATDVILLLSSVFGLAVLAALAVPPSGIERALLVFVSAVPSALDGLWRLLVALLAMWSAVILLATAYRRRWRALRDLAFAGIVVAGLAQLIGRIVLGTWPAAWDSVRLATGTRYFPPLALAIPCAVLIAASPHLSAPARRLGRWLVLLGFVAVVLHTSATASGAAIGILVATSGAAAAHLVFGSPTGRPSLDNVAAAVARLGIQAHALGVAERQAAGVFLVEGADDADQPLLIKVYGRDAHDTQLLNTAWRTVWYREAGSPTSFGRLQQAEHEALMTVLAERAGVPTDSVLMASATPDNDVVLVLRRVGTPLSDGQSCWDDTIVAHAWQTLLRLHSVEIAHGQVDGQHLVTVGQNVGLMDFRGATVAPTPEQLGTDHAQLLVTTALAVGIETAIAAATESLGPDGLAAALPFVQLPALTPEQRRAVRQAGLDLDKLRKSAADKAEISAPELIQLRRVTVRALVQLAMLVLAFTALASAVGGLDFDLLGEQLRHASWWFVVVGAVLAQTPRVTSAVSVLGASPVPIPLGPVYALQLATSYIALAIPSTAARVAINIRFFQRHGLRSGAAVAIGALDGISQFVVEAFLLVSILLLTPATLEVGLGNGTPSGLGRLVIIVAAVAVAAFVTLLAVGKWRRFVFGWIREFVRSALDTARGLQSPRRLSLLFGGNLATELLFAFALQTFVRGFGYHVGLAELLFIDVTVSLLSGLLPIPGGIGVVEGGLTFGLVRAGIPEETAFAAVLLYRLATFYLPPIWGFFAMRWLERNKHL